ncbi:MAG TPA: ABC transporter substrate-binding protein [Povalibacter sp.]|uniref:ABC transporter substrate-binding protein n=1 Tax=Povalibacter sp. TaxID=1962978 RepID=UPI002C56335F|nr:ABC transporter substrate-binding protein [Povalibacter sp.]HMN46625.1 ABC transporter substrate-binding protein [Povalibacter sp.]
MDTYPSRIVCLSTETAETLCLLGEDRRIAGFAGTVDRLPESQHKKPRVSIHGVSHIDRIGALQPDLVLGCGETHGATLAALSQHGVAVHLFNQQSVRGILDMIRIVGAMVGREAAAAHYASTLEWRVESIRSRAAQDSRPGIYFEEWDEPAISASQWVSELISIAGGTNCFAELARHRRTEERVVADHDDVVSRAPDIIIASWNGKPFRRDAIERRNGWQAIPAVRDGEIHEIRSSSILQPGPAALTDGLDALHGIVELWRERRGRMFHTPMSVERVEAAERVA